jgi:hypothetical protein
MTLFPPNWNPYTDISQLFTKYNPRKPKLVDKEEVEVDNEIDNEEELLTRRKLQVKV